MCSKCGAMGRRYSIKRNPEVKRLEVKFSQVDSLFACPKENCLLAVNGDYNASVNLHKIFYRDYPFTYRTIQKDKNRNRSYLINKEEVSLDEIETKIKARLEQKGYLRG